MDLKELQKFADQELHTHLSDLRKKVREFRFSIANSQLKNVRMMRQSKKEIAQVLTELNKRRISKSSVEDVKIEESKKEE
ncbi:MAG: ribosomal protein [Patescibacteria group bacterium]|jgi:ribosomal protein L29|nr:ribosomal protein [Patescibacteria group bacterium]MDQ5970243.1 ribosomal protein [Patescibacteria group bacterium]